MTFAIGSMTIGDILDRSLKILLHRLGLIYAINFLAYSPSLACDLYAAVAQPDRGELALLDAYARLSGLLSFLMQPVATAATLHVIAHEYSGRSTGLGRALSFAGTRFTQLLRTSLLAGLAVLLGLIALIVPGVIIWLNYSLVAQVVVVEGLSDGPALRRSKFLTAGFRPRILAIGLLVGLVIIGSAFSVGMLEFVFPSTTAVLDASGEELMEVNLVYKCIDIVAGELVQTLVFAWSSVCFTLVYFDLRARKEGYDLELAARMDGPGTAL